MKRLRPEAGAVAGAEAAALGLLVFVIGALVVVNAWAVIDSKLVADAAAREAVRSYVEARSTGEAELKARRAVDEVLKGHGRHADRATISLPTSLARCTPAAVSVRVSVPLVAIPLLPSRHRAITVTGRHAELVDPYRSGLSAGESDACPR